LIDFDVLVLEKIFFLKFSVFLLFYCYLPLEKGFPLRLNKLESSSPKGDLCQVWLKLAQWFWRRILNDPTVSQQVWDDKDPSLLKTDGYVKQCVSFLKGK
jgi:hypothetical protein